MKEGYVEKGMSPQERDLELINTYTRRKLEPEEVYTFSVTLCDNEVDRDWEAFSGEALEKLAELFVGKTGIADHERKSANQAARIYRTELVWEEEKRTALGEKYGRLVAYAYIPRTESSREIIEKIDSGIWKEVSVGCSVRKSVCSICGKERCSHEKGRKYQGRVCARVLMDPADAYEFSFVAVPAQRNAGVNSLKKQYRGESDMKEKLKALQEGEEITLGYEEAKQLLKLARWGEFYRENLRKSVKKYSRILQPTLGEDLLDAMTEALGAEELKQLEDCYSKMAQAHFPPVRQLDRETDGDGTDNVEFRI